MPRLNELTLYLGDHGRIFCGREACAGPSIAETGIDFSGHHVVAWRPDEAFLYGLGCEGCGMQPELEDPLVLPSRVEPDQAWSPTVLDDVLAGGTTYVDRVGIGQYRVSVEPRGGWRHAEDEELFEQALRLALERLTHLAGVRS